MSLDEAVKESQLKRDLFNQDTHVLKDNDGKYFTVIETNLKVFLKSDNLSDKSVHYTAWNLIK